MTRWEYTVVGCLNFYCKADYFKGRTTRSPFPLDPDVNWQGFANSYQWVIWTGEYYTMPIYLYLNTLGDKGWELVGTSPPLMEFPAEGGQITSSYYVFLKRPKE